MHFVILSLRRISRHCTDPRRVTSVGLRKTSYPQDDIRYRFYYITIIYEYLGGFIKTSWMNKIMNLAKMMTTRPIIDQRISFLAEAILVSSP